MALEDISVVVGGSRYNSWLDLNVRAAFHEACRQFTFKVAAEQGASAANAIFQTGTPVEIVASGDLLFSGFVNRRVPRFTAAEASITISGRAKGQDHVDSSCLHETGYFEKMDPLEIGNALGSFASRFKSDRQLSKIESFQVTPGATVYETVEALCRDQGKTLCGQADGTILITDATQAKRHGGMLAEGVNIKEAEGDFSDENRHSETHVRGQRARSHGSSALRQHAVATDDGVGRHRPEVHHHRGDVDDDGIKRHAADRRNRKAGNGIRATIGTPSWRDEDGTLWTPGYRIFTSSTYLDLMQDMLVESIDFKAASKETGTMGHLGLVDARAYGGSAGKASQSGSAWSMDGSAAT